MKECPVCHCQVVSEVKTCPYCGTELEYTTDRTETVYSQQTQQRPIRKLDTSMYDGPVQRPAAYPPPYGNTSAYYNRMPVYPQSSGREEWGYTYENREQKGNGLVGVLVALLGCMIVANVLELIALLLLLK